MLDSDSDGDSLPDLDWGELNARTTTTTTTIRPVVDRFQSFAENTADELHRPTKKGRIGRKSFNLLIDTAQKNAELERRIQEQKANLDRSSEEPAVSKDEITKERLEHAVHEDDDPEKAHRLYLAMQRTNAAQTVRVYHFFEPAASDAIIVQPSFPMQCLPNTQWAGNFKGTHTGSSTVHGFRLRENRLGLARPGFRDWLCPPDLSLSATPRRACLMDAGSV